MKRLQKGEKINGFTLVEELPRGRYEDGTSCRKVRVTCPHCDNDFDTNYAYLTRKNPLTSCGCQRSKMRIDYLKTENKYHGQSSAGKRSPEYKSWFNMKARCYNPKNNRYQAYGGRGIRVCDRWLNSYINFFEDLGPRPTPDHSLDRIDVNGMYEPGNCKWSTFAEQMANKRPQKGIERIKVNVGDRFGKLVILSKAEPYVFGSTTHFRLNVKCDCGNYFVAKKTHLTTGKLVSCFYCKPAKKKTGKVPYPNINQKNLFD